jgi:hypothetical protein
MNRNFWQVNEDPSYDEDGVLAAEFIDDSDWEYAFESNEGWTEKAIKDYEARLQANELESFDPQTGMTS